MRSPLTTKAKWRRNRSRSFGARSLFPHRRIRPDTAHQAADGGKAAPREGSKLASVIALLRRSEGATIVVLTEATGWLPHTTRAAITGVRKRGYSVVLDRSEEGASVYRLSDPPNEGAPAIPQGPENKPPVPDANPRRKQAA